jgi:hypothetical protein
MLLQQDDHGTLPELLEAAYPDLRTDCQLTAHFASVAPGGGDVAQQELCTQWEITRRLTSLKGPYELTWEELSAVRALELPDAPGTGRHHDERALAAAHYRRVLSRLATVEEETFANYRMEVPPE